MLAMSKRFWEEEEAAGLAEYSLLLSLIALLIIAALTSVGAKVSTRYDDINNQL